MCHGLASRQKGDITFFLKFILNSAFLYKVLSYHLFFLLLLREFRARFPNDKVSLFKLKLDFEESMHLALKATFRLSGCHFHFG